MIMPNSPTSPTPPPVNGHSSPPDKDTPIYNLKAVVTETGLKPDTLRAWERRYGLPSPDRTGGGHRLYSQRDIELLKWLIQRQDEGMSISRAVRLWRQMEKNGTDPLTESESSAPVPPSTPTSFQNNTLDGLRQGWISACMQFDERQAEQIISQAFALFPLEMVCFNLLQKGLSEIGQGWYQGQITVQQEHFASALALRRLETLVASTPLPTRPGRILAVCPPLERHTFSLLLITLLLRRGGWDVVYLGANVPTDRLTSTIAVAKPKLIILSAQTLPTAATLLPMAHLLHQAQIPSAYGGAVFNVLPQLRRYIPSYFLGTQLELASQTVEQLLTHWPPLPPVQTVGREFFIALEHYRSRQASIEAKVWQLFEKSSEAQHYLHNANRELGHNIEAALTFGQMDLLTTNIQWVRGLLINYHYRMPDELLNIYLESYLMGCQSYLDERGKPIVEWLETVLQKSH